MIGGGYDNEITAHSGYATIAGGELNLIGTYSYNSAIGGGEENHIAAFSYHSTIGGGVGNDIGNNSSASTIAGGFVNEIAANSAYATLAGGNNNDIGTNSESSAIGGGYDNNIAANSQSATIAGGYFNDIGTNSDYSAIGGGFENTIANNSQHATVAGGYYNTIAADSQSATIAGGYSNDIGTNSGASVLAGGWYNTIVANAAFATIPGGRENAVSGYYGFAAGRRAKANHTGAFVWADSQATDFASTAANQFSIRASGGVRLSDDTPELSFGSIPRQMVNLYGTTYGLGVQTSTLYQRSNSRFSWFKGGTHSSSQNDPGAGGAVLMTLTDGGLTVNGTFVSASDRNAKEGFETVKPGEVLDKVLALPLSRWNYKTDSENSRHLGPMAQDFHAAFGLGTDDKHIATVDADGVALAAIQGLNQKVEEKEVRIKELEARLERLEQLLNHKTGGQQ
jgi:hypothetical protein